MDLLSEELKYITRTRVPTPEEREKEKIKSAESFALKMAVGFLVFQASMLFAWKSRWAKTGSEVGGIALALSVSNVVFHCFSGWSAGKSYRSILAGNPRAALTFRTTVAVAVAAVASLIALGNVLGVLLMGF